MATIVETHELTKRYDQLLALDHLSFQIPEGAIFGFIGPNGAGKTTTMRILTTLLRPTSGEALVAGHSVTKQPRQVRQLVGFMPDFFGVYDSMTSWEYLDFFGRAYGVAADRRARIVDELLDLVDLGHKRDALVMSLSRGMKQRLSLARTMVHDPQLLILDEPASGLDPRARIELRELLKELRALGKTIMISSHILTELAEMCTHIAILERGRLLASGDVQAILRSLQPHVTLEIRLLDGVERAEALLRGLPEVLSVRRLVAPTNGSDVPASAPPTEHDGDVAAPAPLDAVPQALVVDYAGDEASQSALLAQLIGDGLRVTRFSEQHNDLEDIFMQITKGMVQ